MRRFRSQRGSTSSLERPTHGQGNAVPFSRFLLKLLRSGLGQAVILGATVVFGSVPEGSEPARLLEPVECREQGAGLDDKRPLCHLLDSPRHPETMKLAGC